MSKKNEKRLPNNGLSKKMPTAYGKARAAASLFIEHTPWYRIAAYPDSPGDLVARLAFLLSVGVVIGALVVLHALSLPVPFLVLLTALAAMGLIAAHGDPNRLLYLTLSLSVFAVGLAGGML